MPDSISLKHALEGLGILFLLALLVSLRRSLLCFVLGHQRGANDGEGYRGEACCPRCRTARATLYGEDV
jgi:hypothetical protein